MLWKNEKLPLTVAPSEVPLPAYFPDTKTVRRDVARNYSNIELLDKEIGKLLDELEADGLMEETIIFFFSDHGGPMPRGKRAHYVSGLQVPFMVYNPKMPQQSYSDRLISFVDIAPTMLSIAGLEIPRHMQGQAFLGPQKLERERSLIFGSADRFGGHADRIRSVISKKYVYVKNYYPKLPAYKDISYRRNIPMMNELVKLHASGQLTPAENYWFRLFKTEEEFYLRDTDPHSLHNLISDGRYRDEIEQMRKALSQWEDEVGDLGAIPEREMLSRMWPGGIQPQTAPPTSRKKGKTVTLSCLTPGSSIAYLLSKKVIQADLDDGWKVYSEPITLGEGEILYAMGVRIGYKDSEIVIIK